ncbi:MAG: hypothetical protein ACFFDR_13095, partial [Candidatus Thorarchaeota archaeon]
DVDEEEEDVFFPDEDEEEIEYRRGTSALNEIPDKPSFMDDPWPPIAFILILIGFGFTLLTPVDIWSQHVYYLVTTYLLLVFVAIASVISLGVWKKAGGSRLRFGGITNLLVVLICGAFGTVDTLLVVTTGNPLIPGTNTPVLLLAFVIVIFSLYSLWLIQRTFATDVPKQQ